MSIKPTVISTFAGCGGSSLGYKLAGYNELLATDWDDNSIKTLKLNFTDLTVLQKDIKQLTVNEIFDLTKIKVNELDVLDGSPPCQGFSMAGDRKISDQRNDLFIEYIRLINGLKPKVFVMENVSGIIKGKMQGKFKEIYKELTDCGYNVKVKLMNAKYYNVPQSRERLIFIGVRNDIKIEPVFPTPNNHLITFNDATKNLVITEQKREPGIAVKTRVLAKAIEGEGGDKYNYGSYFNWSRVARYKPSPTIIKTACLLHYKENRYLTIQELKRIATFPDDFIFIGSHSQQWARIGNAVMPKFMEAIAKTIKEEILNKIV